MSVTSVAMRALVSYSRLRVTRNRTPKNAAKKKTRKRRLGDRHVEVEDLLAETTGVGDAAGRR